MSSSAASALAFLMFAWSPVGATQAQATLSIDQWGHGPGRGFYSHIAADCETLVHSFGRNAVWGRWTAPLEGVRFSVRSRDPGAAPHIFVECLASGGCIFRRGGAAPEPWHHIEFGDQASSEVMVARIEAHMAECAARF